MSVLVEFTTGATGSIATVVNDELVRSSFLDYAETPDLIGGAGVEPVEAPLDLSHSRPQPRQHVVEEPDTPSAWDALRDIS